VGKNGLKVQSGWASNRLRLTIVIGFGGLLALMVLAGLDALRLTCQLRANEEEIRQAFQTHSQSLFVLSSSIHVYNDRMQEYLLSRDLESDAVTAGKFSELTGTIDSTLRTYPPGRQQEEGALLARLQQLFVEQQGEIKPMLSWSREERRRRAEQLLEQELLPQRVRIRDLSEKIAVWNHQQSVAAEQETFASFISLQSRQTRMLSIALGVGLVLSLVSIIYLIRIGKEAEWRYLELARSRAELEALSAQLVDAQETERRSISRELHDEVGQSLGGLLVEVGRLGAAVAPDNTQIQDHVARIKSVAENTVHTVRNIALLLRPSMLDDLGLIPALEWQGREVSRRSEMEVEIQSAELSENIPDEYKICIYRLVQEAFNNAVRHSSARNARVKVEQAGDKILLQVSDDGRGFDPQRVRGLGILGMEERVRRLGGKLIIDSKPGHGTTLKAEFPLTTPDIQRP
jgi:signal transduction histidine kinase